MDVFVRLLAGLLAFYYHLVPNYAAAITLLTFTVMIFVMPLTLKATRSMLAMHQLSPELNKLKEKHKNDRQKLNEEVQKLFRDNKISPLGGCLPMLLQLPVFIVMYNVINGLTHETKGVPDPKSIDKGSKLYHDLVEDGGRMPVFGMDLAKSAIGDHGSVVVAIPFFALILAMVALQYVAQKQVSARAPASNDPQAQQMQAITKILPAVFGVMAVGFPAALVLYWTMQGVARIIQQWAMYRFDPVLNSQVKSAQEEVGGFLKEADASPRALRGPARGSGKAKSQKGNKKRKGR